jgi:D-cysteine desulfhydrase
MAVHRTREKIVLGSYPTPVERLPALGLWVKRDDLTSDVYGGNKVRKLEYFLGAARAAGKSRILTLGAVGSHQVVATAIYGRMHGFATEAVLVGQPASAHARLNVRVALAHGLVAVPSPAWAIAPIYVARRRGADAYYVPLGGSNALGSLGFIDAARELASQVRAGQMPEPDMLVVALGSGGTTAGLAVGLEEAQMKTRVVGVAVSHPTAILGATARRLARQTAELSGLGAELGARAARRIEVVAKHVGRGYGHPTPEGQAAIVDAAASGIAVDPTYTAKSFACALGRARASTDEVVLYWHTLSTAPLEALAGDDEVPPRVARLLR